MAKMRAMVVKGSALATRVKPVYDEAETAAFILVVALARRRTGALPNAALCPAVTESGMTMSRGRPATAQSEFARYPSQ